MFNDVLMNQKDKQLLALPEYSPENYHLVLKNVIQQVKKYNRSKKGGTLRVKPNEGQVMLFNV